MSKILKPNFQPFFNLPSGHLNKLKKKRWKGYVFNCENKYGKGHTCGEKKIVHIEGEIYNKKDTKIEVASK